MCPIHDLELGLVELLVLLHWNLHYYALLMSQLQEQQFHLLMKHETNHQNLMFDHQFLFRRLHVAYIVD
jgi:hypothetical protein